MGVTLLPQVVQLALFSPWVSRRRKFREVGVLTVLCFVPGNPRHMIADYSVAMQWYVEQFSIECPK